LDLMNTCPLFSSFSYGWFGSMLVAIRMARSY
jgi:hypothetical protein